MVENTSIITKLKQLTNDIINILRRRGKISEEEYNMLQQHLDNIVLRIKQKINTYCIMGMFGNDECDSIYENGFIIMNLVMCEILEYLKTFRNLGYVPISE